jgi:hypothetical protein
VIGEVDRVALPVYHFGALRFDAVPGDKRDVTRGAGIMKSRFAWYMRREGLTTGGISIHPPCQLPLVNFLQNRQLASGIEKTLVGTTAGTVEAGITSPISVDRQQFRKGVTKATDGLLQWFFPHNPLSLHCLPLTPGRLLSPLLTIFSRAL